MKQTPQPISKITRPVLPKVVKRPRLIKWLDQAMRRSVVWLSGPPGSGKTTLIATYLAALTGAVLWYQVDAGDTDPAAFFFYLGLAVKKYTPHRKQPLPILTPEYQAGLETFTRRFVYLLCDCLPNNCVLVLDNYHAVSPDSSFHEVIRIFLDAIPEGRQIIVISRGDPPTTLTRLRANQKLEVMDGNMLRATLQETRGIVRLRASLPEKVIRRLHEVTGGWIAGIVLMAQRASMIETWERELPARLSKEVFDYFSGEIFDRLDSEIQEFLLRSSFLEIMTESMLKSLTGKNNSRYILDGLVRQTYFTEKRGDIDAVYQYHSLFRQFLLQRAVETWDSAKLTQVQRRAAILLEKDGQYEDAIGLYQAVRNWGKITKLLLQQAPLLMSQGRNMTLEACLNKLPSKVIDKNPWLLYWNGVCFLPFNPPLGRKYLEPAYEKFSRSGDATGSLLAWSGIVNSILFEWGDFSRLDRLVDWLDHWMQKNSQFPSYEIESRVVCDMAQILVFRQLDHPKIHEWMERTLTLFRNSPEKNLRLQLATAITNYYMWTGQFRAAEEIVGEIQKICRSPGLNPMVVMQAKSCAAMFICVGTTSREFTMKLVSESLKIAKDHGINLLLGPIYAAAFYVFLNTGDSKSAGEYLEKIKEVQKSDLLSDHGFYYLLSALLAINRGEASTALHYAEKGNEIMVQIGFPVGEVATGIALAQALIENREYSKAECLLKTTNRLSHRIKSRIFNYMCLLTEAQMEFDWGKKGSELRGVKSLRKAMQIGREEGFINMPGWRSTVMAKLCAKACEHGIEPSYVNHLIRTRKLIADASLAGLEQWPWPVKIYTLGRFSLVHNGTSLQITARGQGKAIELLKALIALGSREIDEIHLADIIWPDAEGDKAHQVFRTTLHRLRKILGNDEIISVQDGKVTLDSRLCWVDIWAFERYLGKADISSCEKVVSLYHGRFLEKDTAYSWAISLREHLHAKYLSCLLLLGHEWEKAGKWGKAARYYEHGLGIDPLVEEFYQRLMICHQRLGHRAEAMAVFKRCCEALQVYLDLTPAPETESIARSLQQKDESSTSSIFYDSQIMLAASKPDNNNYD